MTPQLPPEKYSVEAIDAELRAGGEAFEAEMHTFGDDHYSMPKEILYLNAKNGSLTASRVIFIYGWLAARGYDLNEANRVLRQDAEAKSERN